MNFRQMTDEQLGLIILGLRAIYVHDSEASRVKMLEAAEGALALRGKAIPE